MITLRKHKFAFLIFIAVLAGSLLTGGLDAGYGYLTDRMDISKKEYREYMELKAEYEALNQLENLIEERYYLPVEKEDLQEGMRKGLFWGIGDPYSAYLTDQEYEDLIISTSGEYDGIGVTIAPDDDGFINVVAPMDESPAAKAGIKAGDKITAVDGESYNGKTIDAAAGAMRGKRGTKVTITILRDGENMELKITRSKILLVTVRNQILDGNIGYIRISAFEEKTAEDFAKALREMELAKVKGLIVDLRDNPGGLVDVSVDLADQLLPEGVVTYTEDRKGERAYLNSEPGKTDLPYVLLVNNGSASASEIVAGAIKDYAGGKIVGTTTFGKGIIQEIVPLEGGGATKLTIMQYFSPKGNVIHKIGVTPDYVVEYTEKDSAGVEPDPAKDPQLAKAMELLQ